MSQIKRLIVIGGGISGLSYAHYLRTFLAAQNKSHLIGKIILLESSSHIGGSIKTDIQNDGVVHELGPRSVRVLGARGQNTIVLMDQLGLKDSLVKIDSNSMAGRLRYIYKDGSLHLVPASIKNLLKRLPGSKTSLLRVAINDLFKAKKFDLEKYPHGDPPLYDFIAHRFTKAAAECVLDPMIRGITAGDARTLSTRGMFNDFLEKEQAYGSVIKGMMNPPIVKSTHDDQFPNDLMQSKLLEQMLAEKILSYNLKQGLQELPRRLGNSLLNTNDDGKFEMYNQTKVIEVGFNDNQSQEGPCWAMVKTVDGDEIKLNAHHIVSAIPSCKLGYLLSDSVSIEQRNALEFVTNIQHAPVGCVVVEYRGLNLLRPKYKALQSFGLLTHSKAGSKVLGIAFDTTMFPELDKATKSFRMTCMIGGAWFEQVLGTSDVSRVTNGQLEQIALEEIRKILNLKDEPHRLSTWLWKDGIAQYKPGHVAQLAKTRERLRDLATPLTLLGQSYDGVAVNDVIYGARRAADEFVKSL